MGGWLVLLATLLCADVRKESWPDGTPRAEYEVELRANGREVRSGPYRSWHASGTLESEGSFADDQETGRWKFFHPLGERAAEGSFARGQRTGMWETFHPNGTRASKGRYEKGLRVEEWRFWSADGSPDAADSGVHEWVELKLAEGFVLTGYRVAGVPHGEWRSTWPNGAPMLAGRLVRGQREGPWRFHHPDGSVSRILSRTYAGGRATGPAEVEAQPAPTSAPALEPGEAGPAGLEAELEAWVAAEPKELEKLRQPFQLANTKPGWFVAGQRAIPTVLRLLFACDPAAEGGRKRIGRIDVRLLRPLCGGHALVPLGPDGPPSEDAAREFLRTWDTLWAATSTDAWFWRVELPCTPVTPPDDVLIERPFVRTLGALEPPAAPPALYARRFAPRDKKVETPIAAALDWLEANQLPDGRWSSCVDIARTEDNYDAGVTGLALLALLGAGRMPDRSPAVAKAVGWLLSQQGATSGEIPAPRRSDKWLYLHLMATLALCEAQALHPSELLRGKLQKALDVVFASQNPLSGWRYSLPPTDEADTSVTAWAVAALVAAREVGLSGDFDGALAGAGDWIDRVTDPDLGRVGYSDRYETSARTLDNQRFPPEKGEAMTAAGLFVRRLLGVPPSDPLVMKQLELLEALPPQLDPASLALDEYYFFYGAQAAALCDALASTHWDRGLEAIARAQSGNKAARGSWDPVGVWADYGGRVYSTAMLALALEAPFRYALPDQAPAVDPKAKPRKK